LNNYEIMVLRHPSKYETRRLSKAVNAVAQAKLVIPTDDEIGFAKKV